MELNCVVGQMQAELEEKLNKLKAITAIYEKAHKDVDAILNVGKPAKKTLPLTARVDAGQLATINDLLDRNGKVIKKSNNAKPFSASVAAKTREFLDKYFNSAEEFTFDTLLKRVAGLIPEATKSSVNNAYIRYVEKMGWEQTYRQVDGVKMIMLNEKKGELV